MFKSRGFCLPVPLLPEERIGQGWCWGADLPPRRMLLPAAGPSLAFWQFGERGLLRQSESIWVAVEPSPTSPSHVLAGSGTRLLSSLTGPLLSIVFPLLTNPGNTLTAWGVRGQWLGATE